jgi:2-amino-4-hydroxy-6-hydroxymethyldihydropteridine diphosphokinase
MSDTIAAIGLGSNLGNPGGQIAAAVASISLIKRCKPLKVSSIYQSEPLGGMDQPDYFNAAMTLRTSIGAARLLRELQSIEKSMGRERQAERWAARVIDLDLLVFGDTQISEPDLQVPHPGIASRNFVLLPLREICPDLQIPGLGRVDDVPVDHLSTRIQRIRAPGDVSQ